MSKQKRPRRSRRRAKIWVSREYVGLPRKIRKRTDPIVRRINKGKLTREQRSQKGKEIVVKRLKKFTKKL